MIALSVQTKGTLIEKLTLAFQLYDVNGDGVLSYGEVSDIVKVRRILCIADIFWPHFLQSKSNLHFTLVITPKRVTRGAAHHSSGLVPGQHSSTETSQR